MAGNGDRSHAAGVEHPMSGSSKPVHKTWADQPHPHPHCKNREATSRAPPTPAPQPTTEPTPRRIRPSDPVPHRVQHLPHQRTLRLALRTARNIRTLELARMHHVALTLARPKITPVHRHPMLALDRQRPAHRHPLRLGTPGLARRESYVPSNEPGAAHILTRQRAASQDPTRQTRRNTRASSSRASRDTDRPSAPGTRTARPIRTRLNTRRFTANTERSRMTHTVRGQSRPPHLDQPGKCWRGHTS